MLNYEEAICCFLDCFWDELVRMSIIGTRRSHDLPPYGDSCHASANNSAPRHGVTIQAIAFTSAASPTAVNAGSQPKDAISEAHSGKSGQPDWPEASS